MGGASSSRMVLRESAPPATSSGADDVAGVFAGVVTEANNGGFASVRTRNFAPALDLTGFTGIRLRCRGNGLRFKMILRTDAAWDGPSYFRSFDTAAGEWAEVELPFAAFVATRRARTLPDGPPLDARRITSLQLMLSKFEYDGEVSDREAALGGDTPRVLPGRGGLTHGTAQPRVPRRALRAADRDHRGLRLRSRVGKRQVVAVTVRGETVHTLFLSARSFGKKPSSLSPSHPFCLAWPRRSALVAGALLSWTAQRAIRRGHCHGYGTAIAEELLAQSTRILGTGRGAAHPEEVGTR